MSFPYLSDVVQTFTGISLPLPLPMFGLFVGLAVVLASLCLKQELRRLYAAGQIGMATLSGKGANGSTMTHPQMVVADLAFVVTLAGIVGARIFHILENLDQFFADPSSMIFNRSGLSIFGGLIIGTLAGLICVRRWKLPLRPMLDAVAPAMMLGYALGRVGCQVSGDGDWGTVANMALKPGWLPNWFWTQSYENNVVGILIPAPGVYPTPLYESVMGFICFALLWSVRKHPFQIGWLFSLYLLLAGIERLLIEQIRINPVLSFVGLHATQAEFISVAIMALGLVGLVLLSRRAEFKKAGAISM